MIDADHIVRGEGISWMRRYLGEDENAPIRHPAIVSGLQTRIMGVRLPRAQGRDGGDHYSRRSAAPWAATSVRPRLFSAARASSSTSYETGDELFDVMCGIEAELKVNSFFVMDENFLLHRTRAMRLLERMKEAGKSWELSVFASANAIRKYTMLELVELGVSWVWMGLESPKSSYSKLQGTDIGQLTRELREHGIRVQGSTIIGLEHHTPDNIVEEIEAAAQLPDRLPPVHALHAGSRHAALPGDGRAGPFADRCRVRRHPRPVQIQFPARRNLARGFKAVSGLGVLARFRAQWAEPLSHVPDHAPGLAALQGLSRSTRARALCAASEEAQRRLQCSALGDGTGIQESQSQRE